MPSRTFPWHVPKTVIATVLLVLSMSCSWLNDGKKTGYDLREKSLSLIDEGDRLSDKNRPRLALDRYNRAAMIYSSPRAYYQMGRVFESEQDHDRAATSYQEALNLAPDYKEARVALLALGYLPSGYDPTESDLLLAESWKEARQLRRPSGNEPETNKISQKITPAEKRTLLDEISASATAQRMPTQPEVVNVLFPHRSEPAMLPKADSPVFPEDFDIILGTYPYHYRKAQQLRKREQYDKAAGEYARAMRADTTKMDARLDLGDMLMNIERYKQARFHYEQCLEKFPESPRPCLKLGNYFLELDRRAEAREYYLKSLEKDPDYVESHNNLAVMAMQDGRFTEAADILDSVIDLDPDYANAHLNRGIIASDVEKNTRKALRHFRAYIDLDGPRSPSVRNWINDLEDENNRPK